MSVTTYSAPPISPFNEDISINTYTHIFTDIPDRIFNFGSKEYWGWWLGFLTLNNVKIENVIEAIQKDFEEYLSKVNKMVDEND